MEIYRGLAAIGLSLTVLTSEPACGVAMPTPNPERSTFQNSTGQQTPTSEPQRQVVATPTSTLTPDNPFSNPRYKERTVLDILPASELEADLDREADKHLVIDPNKPLKAAILGFAPSAILGQVQIGEATDPNSDRMFTIFYDEYGKITKTEIYAPMAKIMGKYFIPGSDGVRSWQITPEQFYKEGKVDLEDMLNLPEGMQYGESTVEIDGKTVPIMRGVGKDTGGNIYHVELLPQYVIATIHPK